VPLSARSLTVQGTPVPRIGLGTWQVTGSECAEAVADALDLGYRHIDTARAYGNEREVGAAIRASGVPREAIWLTTKVWHEDASAERVRASAEASLRDLGTEYVDLLLLHWPSLDVPLGETIDAMLRLRDEGKALQIGVSNFPTDLLVLALEYGPVFCNQVEYHPYLGQRDLLTLARHYDLLFSAYSPFAHGRLHDDPILSEIGDGHGRTAGQVALRWLLDQPQLCALPKARSHDRRAENLAVFDFALTDDERDQVATLDQGLRTADPPWAPAWD
jgi:2,5-diketo-D-gluconate reductase B